MRTLVQKVRIKWAKIAYNRLTLPHEDFLFKFYSVRKWLMAIITQIKCGKNMIVYSNKSKFKLQFQINKSGRTRISLIALYLYFSASRASIFYSLEFYLEIGVKLGNRQLFLCAQTTRQQAQNWWYASCM